MALVQQLPSLFSNSNSNRKRRCSSPTSWRSSRQHVDQEEEEEGKRGIRAPLLSVSISPSIARYWGQRYSLFSRYDEGIGMDEEGWYSVTPESIAEHQASRVVNSSGPSLVLDAFCGMGGNSIQFAIKACFVIATDIDPNKAALASSNARVYGVQQCIDFIVGDFFQLAPRLRDKAVDVAFLSPPWGGPSYSEVASYSLHMLRPTDGFHMFGFAKKLARSIIMFLPRNVNLHQLDELSWFSSTPALSYDIEHNFYSGSRSSKAKAITAYFGDIVCRMRGLPLPD